MSDVSIDTLISVAIEATDAAAAFLVTQHQQLLDGEDMEISTKESATDYLTKVDGQAQKLIIDVIQQHFPDHRFIGEEEGAENIGDPNSPYEWIIDPLDGTLNFIHARENFGTIVAVQKDGEILAGSMDMPLLNQRFHGGKGAGAFYNTELVKLRNTKGMTDAVLNCNTMRRATKGEDGIYRATMPYCASIENTGCAAQELGEVLRGKTDGAFFLGIRLWDIATGFLLIKEAGGNMKMEPLEPGNSRGGYRCAASTAPIFDELWEWAQTKM
ncbi:MAG: inositol monophosphatase [Candidatus Peribacteraceae bacterium]|jgi:myo-inositol-1(or 4)-monophosphatase|nr:inositol monophosphatase [Candidatus Peribacteraceae bacterium]|tara:strand:+ start:36929 stop:37741 length:813 start_codon:yes stop_codon:yes gene_type:complete